MAPQELRDAEDVQVLDVREDDEWAAGHIEGAVHVPIDEVEQHLDLLAADRPVISVCRSGQRSGKVAKRLAKRGYEAANLDGGLQAWASAGLPLVAADGTPGGVA